MFIELRRAVGRGISVHVSPDTDVLGLSPLSVEIYVSEVMSWLKPDTERAAELPYDAEG